jgi:predicted HTH transcriptional regulator
MSNGKTKKQLDEEAKIGKEIKDKVDRGLLERQRQAQNGKKK